MRYKLYTFMQNACSFSIMNNICRLKECLSRVFTLRPILDYCATLGFKVVGGRRNEEGKKVAIVTDVMPNSIADKGLKLAVGRCSFCYLLK